MDSFTLMLTPAQFAEAEAALASNSQVTNHTESTDHESGTFTASDIDFAYRYDGTSNITLQIVKRHGSFFVNHAPVSLVQSHFQSLIAAE
jgi:hypothetical protein